jgi:2-isopropylmalate synthase
MSSVGDRAQIIKHFDWGKFDPFPKPTILDTTLQDGVQGILPSYPTLEEKMHLADLLIELGIEGLSLGWPGLSHNHKSEVIQLANHVMERQSGLRLACLARADLEDVQAVVDVAETVGSRLEAYIVLGTSTAHLLVEQQSVQDLLEKTSQAVDFAVQHQLDVNFACLDATRSEPGLLRILYSAALHHGASRLTVPDTAGVANAISTMRIVKYIRDYVIRSQAVELDWQGHNDRGLAVSNALTATVAGADCLHTTILGMGERCGNVALEPSLANLYYFCGEHYNLKMLSRLSEYAAAIFGEPVPSRHPVIGANAYASTGGSQSELLLKASALEHPDLIATIYSGVDPRLSDRIPQLQVGPLSSSANVKWKATQLGLPLSEELTANILRKARELRRVLTDDEIREMTSSASQHPVEE